MPYRPEHKQETRKRIVHSARRLFNRNGFAAVSIDEIMAGAGLTRGGFYNHFATKEELFKEAALWVLTDNPARHWPEVEWDETARGEKLARMIVNAYLSRTHYEDVDSSCPLIVLPTDMARGGPELKAVGRSLVQAMAGVFSAALEPNGQSARARGLALTALCVGGMVLARAVDDEALADDIREAAHALALETSGWGEVGTKSRAA